MTLHCRSSRFYTVLFVNLWHGLLQYNNYQLNICSWCATGHLRLTKHRSAIETTQESPSRTLHSTDPPFYSAQHGKMNEMMTTVNIRVFHRGIDVRTLASSTGAQNKQLISRRSSTARAGYDISRAHGTDQTI